MFAGLRTAARPMAASARQARMYSSAAKAAPAAGPNPVVKFLKDIPVDVYPLCGLVTIVVSASFYMVGHHLMDPHLRLLPQGATPIPNLNLKKE
ncbi:hypothetical protein A1Q2_02143 [Trichosporon asahii var. asahii CBS 8904]|uniref:Uncharacterized protein n=2 Tax=Trichosporon asahii var. asahii TaxID=189963 RepID=K1VHH9_TRIAC|nr:hypothetical protein A1Q1_04059 [Trichosporon asahii var. asahii CBS 2479]EJT47201.1 hypothetical protein A1Q1_04059 [Trichosporon asahii var. asahii CBS 2479]EKD03560.1 hypothetical protein A1Q2_02143 [Trichosporon asahii var. asahii CBS 8904]